MPFHPLPFAPPLLFFISKINIVKIHSSTTPRCFLIKHHHELFHVIPAGYSVKAVQWYHKPLPLPADTFHPITTNLIIVLQLQRKCVSTPQILITLDTYNKIFHFVEFQHAKEAEIPVERKLWI